MRFELSFHWSWTKPLYQSSLRIDLGVAHHDREPRRIRQRIRRVERQVVAEGERAVVVRADPLRRHHRPVPHEPRLVGVRAAAGHVGERVLERVVAAVGAAMRGGQPGVEVGVRVQRPDVELVASVQADVFEVVDPARRPPARRVDVHVREVAVDAILADVREARLVGGAVAEQPRPADVEHAVVGVELDLPVLQRLAALEVLADRRRHLALPAEAEVVRPGGVVDPRERAQRLDRPSRPRTRWPAAPLPTASCGRPRSRAGCARG